MRSVRYAPLESSAHLQSHTAVTTAHSHRQRLRELPLRNLLAPRLGTVNANFEVSSTNADGLHRESSDLVVSVYELNHLNHPISRDVDLVAGGLERLFLRILISRFVV